jgi:hypothetical protein
MMCCRGRGDRVLALWDAQRAPKAFGRTKMKPRHRLCCTKVPFPISSTANMKLQKLFF